MDVGGGELIMLFNFIKLLGLYAICIKIVLKGGSGGPPPENFYRIRYKIRQFYPFFDTSNDICQCCYNKRVDGIYVICII